MKTGSYVLSSSSVRRRCEECELEYESTKDISPSPEILGQTRAMESLKQGLSMFVDGYNIFVSGEPGTGRSTAVRTLVKQFASDRPVPTDLCYVNNFHNPDLPRAINLPAGDGSKFRDEMWNLISSLRTKLPLMLESDEFENRRREVVESYKKQELDLHKELESTVTASSFAIVQVQAGSYVKPELVVVIEGQGVPINQLGKMVEANKITEEQAQSYGETYKDLSSLMEITLKKTRAIEREIQLSVKRVAHELAEPLIKGHVDDIRERFVSREIGVYLNEVEKSILSDLVLFAKSEDEEEEDSSGEDAFLAYRVNVAVDNSDLNGAPVIVETSPSYTNMFGLIEKQVDRSGRISTNFMKIKPGCFLRANGGYLVLNAQDVITESGVWATLKRSLRNQTIEVHTFEPLYGMIGTTALKPEPVSCDVKVIMIGESSIYHLLYSMDNEFKRVFKIKAEFDNIMERDDEGRATYTRFLRNMVGSCGLKHFDASGIAAMLEYGSRECNRNDKLTTRFGLLADVAREASLVAHAADREMVGRNDVEEALKRRIRRVSLVEDKYQELIMDGIQRIDTTGSVVGQVNGLAVYQIGDHAFGKPTRITAQVGMGQHGIISIEREVKLSGNTHNKGVLILTGFMRSRFSLKWPMNLSATLCFEQSYSEIDGDSASSAEVYALFSTLAGLPIRQDIAVTGSVDQMGNIQPIGGVNEKIEGFFRVCVERKLTGTQGVIIPSDNIASLMVSPEVSDAIERKQFTVYAIDHVDQGLEILTGKSAGKKMKNGAFPVRSINGLVETRLKLLALGLKEFGKEGGRKKSSSQKKATTQISDSQ